MFRLFYKAIFRLLLQKAFGYTIGNVFKIVYQRKYVTSQILLSRGTDTKFTSYINCRGNNLSFTCT